MFALFVLGLISALCVMSITPVNGQSATNDWDRPLDLTCQNGHALGSWRSYHSKSKRDRKYTFHCNVYVQWLKSCYWTSYVNGFDQPVDFKCGPNQLLAGISSYHSDAKEDRRWKFRCCSTPIEARECYWTSYLNDMEEQNYYQIPSDRVVKGAQSYHSNDKEDRRWQLYICRKEWRCQS